MISEKTCGKCKWWHDDTGVMEPHGVRRCFAMPYDQLMVFQSTADATCILPDKFETAKGKNQ